MPDSEPMKIDPAQLARMVKAALDEDIGSGDVTGHAIVDPSVSASAEIISRGGGVVCGLEAARVVFRTLDPDTRIETDVRDGDSVEMGGRILELRGAARALLAGERTALNFLQRLSGIATLTRAFVDAVAGRGVEIYDTRKTTPLWRSLEKDAVRCGGGRNHRFGLYDQAMLKENHLAFLDGDDGSWREAIRRAREKVVVVVVEARTEEEALRAARAGADGVLLDNFSLDQLAETIPKLRGIASGRPFIEVSGGVALETVGAIAALGPDRISVGAMTHSARPLDMTMKVLPVST
ncbi:MAG: carboxylating nicotinate-nucleotide diphosphorylase [Planctomycetota bacterium]|nr:carboxylating nicotinate-nucleotide diphosphorylase [Planctomycetota bacterium]